MKSITIKGSERESVGKVATKALRNAGLVPCVLYGGKQAVHFSAEEIAFKNLVYTPNAHTVVIELGSKKFNAILPASISTKSPFCKLIISSSSWVSYSE